MEQKRIHVGNLPLQVSQNELEKKFSKFGKVVSTEIKQRFGPDNEVISKFAFVTLEASRNSFDTCIKKLSSSTWKGNNLKLEFAKESFLSKLKKEREENLIKKLANEDKSSEVSKSRNVEESSKLRKHKKVSHEYSNGYQSDSSSNERKNNLVMFKGTKAYSLPEESNIKESKKHSNLNQENVSMKTFEDFSDVWRDDYDFQVQRRTPKKSEELFIHEKNKKPKLDSKEENLNEVTKEEAHSSKWFPKSSTQQNINHTLYSANNLKDSSSEDDYKTLKTKPYTDPSNSDHNFLQKNTEPNEIIDNQNSTSSHTVHFNHVDFNTHEDKNCLPEIRKKNFSVLAEEKRKKAFEEKRQLISEQKNAVKKALSGVDTKGKHNKKIIFSDNEEDTNEEDEKINLNTSFNDVEPKRKMLFDEESDNDESSFKINQQFEGDKGQKLLELQSRYAHDSRFALDSRFYESDDENVVEGTSQLKNEKEKQLEILEQVIGYQVRKPETKKKISKPLNTNLMLLRFDPTRKEHKQFIVQPTQQPEVDIDIKEKKRKRKESDNELVERKEEKVVVSKETFYKVNEKLKDSLQTKDDFGFSLRKLFNSKEADDPEKEAEVHAEQHPSLPPKRLRQSNPFKYDSSDTEDDEDKSLPVNKSVSQPTLLQPFFFQTDDLRFEELKEFFGKHEKICEEEFSKKRKDLKRLIHHRQLNKKQKNNPYKNKLGGARKKTGKKRTLLTKAWNQRRKKVKPHMYK